MRDHYMTAALLAAVLCAAPLSAKASDLTHRIDGVKSVKNELRVAEAKAS